MSDFSRVSIAPPPPPCKRYRFRPYPPGTVMIPVFAQELLWSEEDGIRVPGQAGLSRLPLGWLVCRPRQVLSVRRQLFPSPDLTGQNIEQRSCSPLEADLPPRSRPHPQGQDFSNELQEPDDGRACDNAGLPEESRETSQ